MEATFEGNGWELLIVTGEEVPAPFPEAGLWLSLSEHGVRDESKAMLEPAQARELAAALLRAADEAEARERESQECAQARVE
ncbi:hypothetical protein AB0I84_43085 [Streptomyces spectabilis]|uniref:hypothetical protein n=1 Tax=Streptomyces spectabilis TaxID=68270 RepID=UPI0033EE6DB6